MQKQRTKLHIAFQLVHVILRIKGSIGNIAKTSLATPNLCGFVLQRAENARQEHVHVYKRLVHARAAMSAITLIIFRLQAQHQQSAQHVEDTTYNQRILAQSALRRAQESPAELRASAKLTSAVSTRG